MSPCFQWSVVADGPAVAPGGRGSKGPGVSILCRGDGGAWSAGGEGLESADGLGGLPPGWCGRASAHG